MSGKGSLRDGHDIRTGLVAVQSGRRYWSFATDRCSEHAWIGGDIQFGDVETLAAMPANTMLLRTSPRAPGGASAERSNAIPNTVQRK